MSDISMDEYSSEEIVRFIEDEWETARRTAQKHQLWKILETLEVVNHGPTNSN